MIVFLLLQAAVPITVPPVAPAPAVSLAASSKRICKTIQPTGSRLGGTRVCQTKQEWDERARLDQQSLFKAQGNIDHITDDRH